MGNSNFVVVTDRGGHLHDALRLIEQMAVPPVALLTTVGPDVDYLKTNFKDSEVVSFPQAFSWWGKQRFFNPALFILQIGIVGRTAWRLKPQAVVSTGASGVVLFCYFAWALGAKIYHVENLAQVVNPSITGKMLYPICTNLYVQWNELLQRFGPKARYEGWVL